MVSVCPQEDHLVGVRTAHFLWSRLVIVGIGHILNLLCSQNGQVLVGKLRAMIQTGCFVLPIIINQCYRLFGMCVTLSSLVKGQTKLNLDDPLPTYSWKIRVALDDRKKGQDLFSSSRGQ